MPDLPVSLELLRGNALVPQAPVVIDPESGLPARRVTLSPAGVAVLRLRALRASGAFDAYWTFHEAREFQRNHALRYAGGIVPPVSEPPPPEPPRLRKSK